jgi:DNA-binding winged helix-turn-helix (wHTH) protein
VRALRQKLGKDPNGQEYIRNVPNRGYYLAASARQKAETAATESHLAAPEARQEQIANDTLNGP